MTNQGQRRKIAILGGGVGAMTAAYELTERPEVRDQLDITVYQLGWRLGGKGASGRNAAKFQRIEEHGLHIWFGFYENAFDLIQRCYQEHATLREQGELGPSPFASWKDAFKQQDSVVWEDIVAGTWKPHSITFPTRPGEPGTGERVLTAWAYVLEILKEIHERFEADVSAKITVEAGTALGTTVSVETTVVPTPHWWERVFAGATAVHIKAIEQVGARDALKLACRVAEGMPSDPVTHRAEDHHALLWLLNRFGSWCGPACEQLVEHDPELRRDWILLDLALAIVRGMLNDGIVFHGYNEINDIEFSAWLLRNGASQMSVSSALVRVLYCLAFAFKDGDPGNLTDAGDPARRAIAAGTGLHGLLRLVFGYYGSIMWKMQAGMGDTIFTPLYEVLVKRGVKFEFFRRVTGLHLSADKSSIKGITLARQATPRNGTYDPLVPVKDLRCWPSEPRYEQLAEGEALRTQEVNLESAWAEWDDRGELPLTRGTDFDDVVLGISLGALPTICKELCDANPAWQRMVDNVPAIRTQAFQLWMKPKIEDLGRDLGPEPVVGSYVEPLDTYADMSHLIDNEAWPDGNAPGSIAYFCGPLSNDLASALVTDHEFPAKMTALVRQNVLAFLNQHIGRLWPEGVAGGTLGLNFDLLAGPPDDVAGEARLDWQFIRANIDPSELYVLSVPGSIQYRLPSDGSGFTNLYLAGDWTLNGLNAGCVEAAVMSGKEASQGICGFPKVIFGKTDRWL